MIKRMRQGCRNIHQDNSIEFDIMFLFINFLDNSSCFASYETNTQIKQL